MAMLKLALTNRFNIERLREDFLMKGFLSEAFFENTFEIENKSANKAIEYLNL